EWNDRYGSLATAIQKKDSRAIHSLMAPDVVWTMQGPGKLNLDAAVKEYGRKIGALANTQFTINATKIDVKGNVAHIERTQILSGFVTLAGKRHHGFDGSAWRDTWQKTAKGWQLKSSEQANQQLTIDGKPGNPYPAAGK